jgi:hypothetical protein
MGLLSRTIASAALLLLLTLHFGCVRPNTDGFKSVLNECAVAQAVQLRFKDGLVDPDVIVAAEKQLAELLPIPVIPRSESTDDQRVLMIFVDGVERNFFEDKSFWGVWGNNLPSNANFFVGGGGPAAVIITGGLFAALIISTAAESMIEYRQHNTLMKEFKYLPYQFKAYGIIGYEDALSDIDITKIMFPDYRFGYTGKGYPKGMRQLDSYTEGTDAIRASLELWIGGLAEDLINNYIGSKNLETEIK